MPMRTMATSLALALLAACGDDPRHAPTVVRDLRVPPTQATPLVPLTDAKLATHADFDQLEEDLLGRVPLEDLLHLYGQLAESADPTRDADALLLVRLAMLQLRASTGTSRLQDAFSIADTLREKAPDSPHSRFLVAHITNLILRPDRDGAFHLDATRRDVAVRLAEHWRSLLAIAPDYPGPEGRDADAIRRDLAALGAALAALPAQDTAEAPEPVALVVEDDKVVTPQAVQARADLYAFEAGSRGDRLSLCRDRRAAGEATTAAERWLTLRCSLVMADPDAAMGALVELVASGRVADPCPWQEKAAGASSGSVAALTSAMKARGLPACAGR